MAAVLKGSGGEWWVLREKKGSHGDEEQDLPVPQLKKKHREEQISKRIRNLSSDPQPFRNTTLSRLCSPNFSNSDFCENLLEVAQGWMFP